MASRRYAPLSGSPTTAAGLMAVSCLGLGLLFLATPSDVSAQIQASPRGQVSQTIDGTTITLDYARPSVRGREIFGAQVPWNVVWTPGANWATTLEVDKPVRLNGVEVPAGKYSVWTIPRPDRFTVMLNPEPEIFHALKPDSAASTVHVAVEPVAAAEHVEMLTWSFPFVRGSGGVLQFQWANTAVPMEVLVRPTRALTVDEETRQLYVGTYDVTFIEGLGFPMLEAELVVFEEDGRLKARLPFRIHPDDELAWDLVPAGQGRFNAGLYRGDELFNIEQGVGVDFDITGDVATTVRFSLPGGLVYGEGTRVPGST